MLGLSTTFHFTQILATSEVCGQYDTCIDRNIIMNHFEREADVMSSDSSTISEHYSQGMIGSDIGIRFQCLELWNLNIGDQQRNCCRV